MGTGKTVLVLHRDGDNGEELEQALTQSGFDVLSAPSVEMATQILWDAEEPINVLVIDLPTASGDSPWTAAEEGRRRSSEIGVVYITSDGPHSWAVSGVPDSILLRKPIAAAQVVTAVANLLNERDSMREPDSG